MNEVKNMEKQLDYETAIKKTIYTVKKVIEIGQHEYDLQYHIFLCYMEIEEHHKVENEYAKDELIFLRHCFVKIILNKKSKRLTINWDTVSWKHKARQLVGDTIFSPSKMRVAIREKLSYLTDSIE